MFIYLNEGYYFRVRIFIRLFYVIVKRLMLFKERNKNDWIYELFFYWYLKLKIYFLVNDRVLIGYY